MITNEKRFIEELNDRLQKNEQMFKVHNAELTGDDSIELTLLINALNYDKYLDVDFKERISSFSKEILPSELKNVKLYFKKTITTEELIKKGIFEYIYKNYSLMTDKIESEDISISIKNNHINICISTPQYIFNYCINNDFVDKLRSFLELEFIEEISIDLKVIKSSDELKIIEKKLKPLQSGLNIIEIVIKDSVISGSIIKKPRCIEEAKKIVMEGAVVCGKVKFLTEREAKSTKKLFYTFKLDDTTASINVAVFPRGDKNLTSIKLLKDGDIIVVEGTIRYSDYDKENSLIANKISKCEVDFNAFKVNKSSREENDEYRYIFPEPYIEKEQSCLFDYFTTSEFLKDKDFVVFDLETTGLYVNDGDEPIEFGAIKIRDGKMIEQFSSFIKPQKEISPAITALTNITNEDVENAPTIDKVMPDFYKFTRNSTLVAHNLPFDFGFIEKFGKAQQYNFDNDCIDTCVLAKNKLRVRDYKLKTLVEEFNLCNQAAHRAIYDAEATAKLFIKLLEMPDL